MALVISLVRVPNVTFVAIITSLQKSSHTSDDVVMIVVMVEVDVVKRTIWGKLVPRSSKSYTVQVMVIHVESDSISFENTLQMG